MAYPIYLAYNTSSSVKQAPPSLCSKGKIWVVFDSTISLLIAGLSLYFIQASYPLHLLGTVGAYITGSVGISISLVLIISDVLLYLKHLKKQKSDIKSSTAEKSDDYKPVSTSSDQDISVTTAVTPGIDNIPSKSLSPQPQPVQWKKVGQTSVTYQNEQREVTIVKRKMDYGKKEYRLYWGEKQLGNLIICKMRPKDNFELWSENYSRGVPSAMAKYGREKQILSKVYIEELHGGGLGSRYKGIGTKLMQVAFEKSVNEGYGGRIDLLASGNSHGFYYKLGYRCEREKNDTYIAEELEAAQREKRDPDFNDHGLEAMFLPLDAIPNWEKRVQENPILYKTKSVSESTI